MLLDQLHKLRAEINAAGREFGTRRIRVFGSVAWRQEHPDSDIDFLVDLPRGYDLFRQKLTFQQRLTEITRHHPDVVPEHELNRHIRVAVLRGTINL